MLDENAKTHPMLRPYKTFSEKVIVHLLVSMNINMLRFSLFAVTNLIFKIYTFLRNEFNYLPKDAYFRFCLRHLKHSHYSPF